MSDMLNVGDAQTVYRNEPIAPAAPVVRPLTAIEAALIEAGLDISPNHAAWGPVEIAIRDRIVAEISKSLNGKDTDVDTVETAPVDETTLRNRLASTILEAADASKLAAGILVSVTRAQTRVNDLAAELESFAGLDGQIVSYTVESIKAGQDHDDLPHGLQHKQTERGKVTDRLHAAAKALDRLLLEQRQLDTKAAEASRRVAQAAQLVIACVAESHIEGLLKTEQHAAELRQFLCSYARTWFKVGSGPKNSVLSAAMYAVINSPPVNADVQSDPATIEHFLAFHARLIEDATAE